jgi:putative transposase
MLCIQPYFPLTHGIAMVDDRRGDQRDRCMERAALARCTGRLRSTQDDLQKFARWNRLELFKNIFAELARKGGVSQR